MHLKQFYRLSMLSDRREKMKCVKSLLLVSYALVILFLVHCTLVDGRFQYVIPVPTVMLSSSNSHFTNT